MSDGATALRNEIKLEAAESENFEIDAFARVFAKRLEEAEQIYDLNVEVLKCRGPRGRRLELLGYAEDTTDRSLILLVGRYFVADETLTMSEARDVLSRATDFIEASVSGWLEEHLEPSSREVEYAGYFARQIRVGAISRVRVVLITDGIMSDRIRNIDSDTTAGIKTSYEIWDQIRILDAAIPERGSEDIHVDLTKWLPNGLPVLLADTGKSHTQTYLAVIPGRVLADVFEEYGSLLLESNVRTFLSARGAVNKGIQATLAQAPDRFLAYNNGITTTATNVDLVQGKRGPIIRSIDRWQIVNGGQTTASIVHFLRSSKDRSVDGVNVQMKLVLVDDSDSSSIVQAVAKYANSQNRVSGADLFSTHEFHVRLERISRRLRAPARESEQFQSGWYYERSRGQWENDRAARGAASEQRKFELEYPKAQRITKTDWAKYAFCVEKKPHLVSKGAQSVFADFATAVDKQWEEDDSQFGDGYFRAGVGKAIMFENLRAMILKQDWYQESPGYLANIVAYAISKFSLQIEIQFNGAKYDFEKVWQFQKISDATLAALVNLGLEAQIHLTDEDRPQANVTQWAKQQACWDRFARENLPLNPSVQEDLVSIEEAKVVVRDEKQQRAMDSGFEAIQRILTVEPKVWETVYRAAERVRISPMERDLIQLFGRGKGKVPSEKQAAALIRLLNRMTEEGVISPDNV